MINHNSNYHNSNYHNQLVDISDCHTLTQVSDKVYGIADHAEKVPLLHKVDKNWQVFDEFDNYMGLRNSRTQKPYGICKKNYQIIQNEQAFKSLGEIVQAGEATFDKAAIFQGGASTFLTIVTDSKAMSYPRTGPLIPSATWGARDVVNNNLFALNDQSARWALTYGSHAIRLFCLNQLPTMDSWLTNQTKFRHTISAKDKLANINKMLTASSKNFLQSMMAYEHMTDVKMSLYKFQCLSERLLNATWGKAYVKAEDGQALVIPSNWQSSRLDRDISPLRRQLKPRRLAKLEELDDLFIQGNQGAGKTQWGALQTVTSWLDHNPKITFTSNLRGQAKVIKDEAFKMITEMSPTSY